MSESFRVERDVAYGTLPAQRLDLYLPINDRKPAAILGLHGGGWHEGERSDPRMVAKVFAPLARRGYVVAAASYRLATEWTFPAQLDDVQLAVRWMRSRAMSWNIDPTLIGAVGGSAGGHLAALLGTCDTRLPSLGFADIDSRVRCVVSLLGSSDLRLDVYLKALVKKNRKLMRQILVGFMGAHTLDDEELWRSASPALRVDEHSAPFFIIHGDQDDLVPVDQAYRLASALAAAGVEVDKIIIPGMTHNIDPAAVAPRVDRALERAWAFLDRHLGSPDQAS